MEAPERIWRNKRGNATSYTAKSGLIEYIRADTAEAKNKQLREALQKIQSWASAYPLKVFPKPNLKKAHKALKAVGMTLDAISADNMRHVINQVTDIVEQALKGE